MKSCEAEGFSLMVSHAGLIEERYAHFKASGVIQSSLTTDCIKVPEARSFETGDGESSEIYRKSTTRERMDERERLHEAALSGFDISDKRGD